MASIAEVTSLYARVAPARLGRASPVQCRPLGPLAAGAGGRSGRPRFARRRPRYDGVDVTRRATCSRPDQVLPTYHPPAGGGAYGARLPRGRHQAKTLPWSARPTWREHPWLALVVFAEGRPSYAPTSPAAECITSDRRLSGSSTSRGVLSRIREVSHPLKIIPTRKDVPLLSPARSISNDTELMMGG